MNAHAPRTTAVNPFVGASVAARYAAARPALHERTLRAVAARLAHARRAVDVGCGTGMSTRAGGVVADHVIGVDVSADMLREADRTPGTSYVLAAAERLPFADAAFDLVTIASAIHRFEPPALTDCRRVLHDDGHLLVYDIWFPAEMTGEPDFGEQLAGIVERRYPAVVKYPRPDRASMGFELLWKDDLRFEVPMTRDALAECLMSHSERIAAVKEGRETEAEQRRFLLDGLAPFFESEPTRELRFGARLELFRTRAARASRTRS
jgi:ubiquinone/menaquinone biosynthesis C-methylase UbiE